MNVLSKSLGVCVAGFVLNATCGSVLAQVVVSPLLVEGQTVSDGAWSATVEGVQSVAVTPVGGVLVNLKVREVSGRIVDVVWGRASSSGAWEVMGRADEFGGAPGVAALTAPCRAEETDALHWAGLREVGGCGEIGAIGRTAAVGRGVNVVAAEFGEYPLEVGRVWRDLGLAGAIGWGATCWVGGYSEAGFGPVDLRGLYKFDEWDTEPIGVVLPGRVVSIAPLTGVPASALTVARVRSGDVGWEGSNAYAVVEMQSDAQRKGHVVSTAAVGGDVLVAVKLGSPPQRVGDGFPLGGRGALVGEKWKRVRQPVVVSSSSAFRFWTMAGQTDAAAANDDVVVAGGVSSGADGVLYREGAMVGGLTLLGPVEHLAGNASGNVAMVWRVAGGAAGTRKALFVDSELALAQDDQVALTTGGTPVMGRLANFPGRQGVALGARDAQGQARVYVAASVDPQGAAGVTAGPDARVAVLYEVIVPSAPSVNPCAADFNGVGGLSLQDLFDFLAAWFAGLASADFNNSGGPPTVQDLFDYLAAYFAGC